MDFKPLEKCTVLASKQASLEKPLWQFPKHLASWLQTANLADGWGRRCVHKQFKALPIRLGALLLSSPSFLCPNVREQTGHAAVAEEYIYLIVELISVWFSLPQDQTNGAGTKESRNQQPRVEEEDKTVFLHWLYKLNLANCLWKQELWGRLLGD